MSGFSASSKLGATFLPSFLILCSDSEAGRQSATAAVAMKRSCSGARGITASSICCAERTSTRVTPRGVGRCTGPATSVTSAPASRAARAIEKPILPLDRLVMPRTGSIASKVGPAVISRRRPARGFGASAATSSSTMASGSIMRPSPISPQAWAPASTPSTCAPSAAIWRRLRCVAGCAHISRFIAGATISGTGRASAAPLASGRARQVRLSRSSARPWARRAMKSALAGATSTASAPRVRLLCGMPLGSRASQVSSATGWPESACIVSAVMKCSAPAVIATRTSAPALTSRRASSALL